MRLSSATQLAQALAITASAAVREQLTSHRATTAASPSEVWDLMSSPASWPSFDPRVARVEGELPLLSDGGHLMAVGRLLGLRFPVDVDGVRVGQSLTTTTRLLPGLSEVAEHQIVPVASGGTQIVSRVRPAGPLGVLATVPTWVSAELVVRLLAWRAGRAEGSPGPLPRTAATTSAATT